MTLTTTVTNILSKRVTYEQAKQFALDNYGVLATYIRGQLIDKIKKVDGYKIRKKRIKNRLKMIRIKRKIYSHLNVIDTVYKDNNLQFEQSNLNSRNRFGNKQFKCKNGSMLVVDLWEWAEKEN